MPRVQNWYKKINPQYLCIEKYAKLPKKVILDMKLGNAYVYTDIITNPFLLVSSEALQVISMYDRDIPFINVILMDIADRGQAVYFIPILERVKSLEKKDIGDRVLFRIDSKINNNVYIRLDLVESLLARDAQGICLKKAFVLD